MFSSTRRDSKDSIENPLFALLLTEIPLKIVPEIKQRFFKENLALIASEYPLWISSIYSENPVDIYSEICPMILSQNISEFF